jgi:transposase-like protein
LLRILWPPPPLTKPISWLCCKKREGKTERDKAFNKMKAAGQLPVSCELRQSKYLNNLIEQNHRFIKRLVKPGMGFWSFETSCGVVRLPRMRFQK